MNVKFLMKNPKEGSNTIHVRVRVGRAIDLFLATKESTSLNDWDSLRGCYLEQYDVMKNGKNFIKRDAGTKEKITKNTVINYRLTELKKNIEESYKVSNEKINSEWLRSIVYPNESCPDITEMQLIKYFDLFIESRGSSISKDYVSKVQGIKKIVERYKAYNRIKKILLTDFDNEFKNSFEKYCLEVEKYSINYFEKNFKFIKTILYHAEQNGYIINKGLSRIRCRTEKIVFVILSPTELEDIELTNFSEEHLVVAKDWLLISCYSGQRISDFMRFTPDMIREKIVKENKRFFIEFTQEKTKKQILLPLSEKIVSILNRRNWNFPRKMSEPRYNEHIKTVCKMAGISEMVQGGLSLKQETEHIKNRKKNNRRKVHDMYPKYKLISSHTGRRSFASNNFGTIPTPLLMVATGHASPNMLMKYIGQIDQQQSMALAEYL